LERNLNRCSTQPERKAMSQLPLRTEWRTASDIAPMAEEGG
jgi:hypothetical protein